MKIIDILNQQDTNKKAKKIIKRVFCNNSMQYVGQLRSCSAWVYKNNDGYILRSYSTVIAVIDTRAKIAVDFLRTAYGYTRTSAQHINKFYADYIPGAWKNTDNYQFLTTRRISDADAKKAAAYLKKLRAGA